VSVRVSPEDAAEVARLYDGVAPGLYRFARTLPNVDHHQAEDLVHAAFMAAAQQWAELRDRDLDGKRAWLLQVLRHKAIDQWRLNRSDPPPARYRSVHDRDSLEEIELYAELIIRAERSDERLSPAEIDAVLGLGQERAGSPASAKADRPRPRVRVGDVYRSARKHAETAESSASGFDGQAGLSRLLEAMSVDGQ
jgi:DNA-directed RNA polymerase specialized sigma24 family protein